MVVISHDCDLANDALQIEPDVEVIIGRHLKIVLAYPPSDDPEQTADEVEKLETAIANLFEERHFDQTSGKWNGIALTLCMSISEDDLRVSTARLLTQWRLEYMTLKADEKQPSPP